MAMNGRPSSSKRTSTESRVVPATSETIIRSACAKVLINVDLPVLGRPTTAIFIASVEAREPSSSGGSFASIRAKRSSLLRFWWVEMNTGAPRPSL